MCKKVTQVQATRLKIKPKFLSLDIGKFLKYLKIKMNGILFDLIILIRKCDKCFKLC